MADNLTSIIDSIELKVQHELPENIPICIYVGIGTYAGLTKEVDGVRILEDENYHQFPPVLQKMYLDNKNMHFFCIYIDPALENPVFITQDMILRQKLFDNNQWKKDPDEFSYQNNRINIYPFRKSIKIKNTKYNFNNDNDYFDITNHMDRLHKICIENNLLYVYHDFSGVENTKYIEEYFMDTISEHLDHIIYGFGNGYISGCYYDLRKSESFFAYIRENHKGREIIKIFNIQQIINMYNILDNRTKDEISFMQYMNNIISIFPEDMFDVILSQIKSYTDNFVYTFKNYIFTLLREIYDIDLKISNSIEIEFDENSHIFNVLGDKYKTKIIDMCKIRDNRIFEKTKEFISTKYKIEFELICSQKNHLKSNEIVDIITDNIDKYKWCDTFNMIIT